MQFLFASGQVSVSGDICQQRIGASLHYYHFYLFIHFPAYSRSLLTLKAETLFSLFILCLLCFFRGGAITLTGMLVPLWRLCGFFWLQHRISADVVLKWDGPAQRLEGLGASVGAFGPLFCR